MKSTRVLLLLLRLLLLRVTAGSVAWQCAVDSTRGPAYYFSVSSLTPAHPCGAT